MVQYTLIGVDGTPYESSQPGTLGGHRASRIYGRLDCPSARRTIGNGGYVKHRVFFADERTAVEAGYRPCARCLPDRYREWKVSGGRAAQSIALPMVEIAPRAVRPFTAMAAISTIGPSTGPAASQTRGAAAR